MDPEQTQLNQQIKERFGQLPKVVQSAITSADVQKHLRDLATTSKLHLDQWETLENQVMMTLLGFQPIEDLQKNIKDEVGISDELAKSLTEDVSKFVFEPIRAELEKQLEPVAQSANVVAQAEAEASGEVRSQVAPGEISGVAGEQAGAPAEGASVVPAASSEAEPQEEEKKVVRATALETYKLGEPSTARKSIEDDPYREPFQ
jgi:hypothetical protein